jgi:hypothetical protein
VADSVQGSGGGGHGGWVGGGWVGVVVTPPIYGIGGVVVEGWSAVGWSAPPDEEGVGAYERGGAAGVGRCLREGAGRGG